ncbi:molybdopterin-binding protein [Amycolatopsis panacis]|uniref:Molybdopterin-binding protein n=1 Tax=Amycolatopsis panacis TaxID=2340917 RepID=A0A419I2E6_9PSEU|nr:molybdopterin-dependent oxidoreductase [Amycolatopsis panacis]RJQ84065.1 molybdopterin-binding protein [Amycolatopsis panacis]
MSALKQAPSIAAPRLSLAMATFLGLVALVTALGVGHFVAAFVGYQASPFVAVADFVIAHSPHPVVVWAERTLGTADKTVLKIGLAVVLAGFAVLTGQLSRRSAGPGQVLIGLLGVFGIVAVYQRTDVGELALLAPVLAMVAAMLVFGWLHRRALPADAEPRTGLTRRQVLQRGATVAVGAGAAAIAGEIIADTGSAASSRASIGPLIPARKAPPLPPDADFVNLGSPPFITPNADFYRIDTAFVVPQVRTDEWQLKIHGMVDREITLSYSDIRNRPLVERTVTLTCVSNEVGGDLVSTADFIGVDLIDLLTEAGVRPGAQQMFATSVDGFTCGTPATVALDPNRGAMLAIGMNGEPLPIEHGFPARIVIPGLYGYVSATKWVTDLEFTTWDARQSYWLQRGWAEQAPIKTESRIDRPASGASVPAGAVRVAGTAWAQHVGIEKVEVRLDQGPWQQAHLSAEVNKDTWRMWWAELTAAAGGHTVTVRATDQSGYTQTDHVADPVPDGATGWHSVSFTAG